MLYWTQMEGGDVCPAFCTRSKLFYHFAHAHVKNYFVKSGDFSGWPRRPFRRGRNTRRCGGARVRKEKRARRKILLDFAARRLYNAKADKFISALVGQHTEMSRSWSSAHDWKSCRGQKLLESSNLSISANPFPWFCYRIKGIFLFIARITRQKFLTIGTGLLFTA